MVKKVEEGGARAPSVPQADIWPSLESKSQLLEPLNEYQDAELRQTGLAHARQQCRQTWPVTHPRVLDMFQLIGELVSKVAKGFLTQNPGWAMSDSQQSRTPEGHRESCSWA